ncbi:transcriptional regulator, partial [Staphylococcus caprae]
VIIEIGIDDSRTVKEIVRDVQEAVLRSSSQANRESGTSESGSKSQPHVRARIQSLL